MRKFFLTVLIFLAPSMAFAQGRTFEDLSKGANNTSDLEKVVGPFLQQCGTGDELPDLHCRAIRQYMQHKIGTQVFTTTVGSAALVFEPYDSVKFMYPVTVNGCLTCSRPMEFDPVLYAPNNKFFITTKVPTKIENDKPVGVDVGKFDIAVDPRELGAWTKKVQPFLQVQFLYRVVADRVWDPKIGAGITLHTGGFRVFNRCTGEVMFSNPPSSGPGPVDKRGCEEEKPVDAVPEKVLPERLTPSQILENMRSIRNQVNECYEQYQIPGVAEVSVTVEGATGAVTNVRLRGVFVGTPTGKCVTEQVQQLKFPQVKQKSTTFSFKYELR